MLLIVMYILVVLCVIVCSCMFLSDPVVVVCVHLSRCLSIRMWNANWTRSAEDGSESLAESHGIILSPCKQEQYFVMSLSYKLACSKKDLVTHGMTTLAHAPQAASIAGAPVTQRGYDKITTHLWSAYSRDPSENEVVLGGQS